MNERQLRENLRRLPEARAGDGFTEMVLARLETAGGRRRRALPGGVLRPALATLALVAVVAAALLLTGPPAPPGPAAGASTEAPAVAAADDPAPAAGRLADAAAGTPLELPPGARAVPAAARSAEEGVAATPEAADPAALRRLAELRRERERLRAQLAALKGLPRREPTLLLGGDETVELVLDLGRAGEGGVRPAGYRPPPSSGGGPRYH